MQRYAQNFNLDNKQSIMLRGSFGLGKSALAMATIKEIKKRATQYYFMILPNLSLYLEIL